MPRTGSPSLWVTGHSYGEGDWKKQDPKFKFKTWSTFTFQDPIKMYWIGQDKSAFIYNNLVINDTFAISLSLNVCIYVCVNINKSDIPSFI